MYELRDKKIQKGQKDTRSDKMAKYDNYKIKNPFVVTYEQMCDVNDSTTQQMRKEITKQVNEQDRKAIDYACSVMISRGIEIKPDELIELIKGRNEQYKQGYEDGYKDGHYVSVRHGHWETGYFSDNVCSFCLHPYDRKTDYCPHCGTMMDEVIE